MVIGKGFKKKECCGSAWCCLWSWVLLGCSARACNFHVQDPAISLGFSVKDGGCWLSMDDNFIVLLASFGGWKKYLLRLGLGVGSQLPQEMATSFFYGVGHSPQVISFPQTLYQILLAFPSKCTWCWYVTWVRAFIRTQQTVQLRPAHFTLCKFSSSPLFSLPPSPSTK